MVIKLPNLWVDSGSVTLQLLFCCWLRRWLRKYHWRWQLIVEGLDGESCISYSELHIGSRGRGRRDGCFL